MVKSNTVVRTDQQIDAAPLNSVCTLGGYTGNSYLPTAAFGVLLTLSGGSYKAQIAVYTNTGEAKMKYRVGADVWYEWSA